MFVIWIALEETCSKSFSTSITRWVAYNNLQFPPYGVKLLCHTENRFNLSSSCPAATCYSTLNKVVFYFAHLISANFLLQNFDNPLCMYSGILYHFKFIHFLESTFKLLMHSSILVNSDTYRELYLYLLLFSIFLLAYNINSTLFVFNQCMRIARYLFYLN